ncbi:hypothetical protein V8C35DRAFT_132817 [Trichoderma chlorosporum]
MQKRICSVLWTRSPGTFRWASLPQQRTRRIERRVRTRDTRTPLPPTNDETLKTGPLCLLVLFVPPMYLTTPYRCLSFFFFFFFFSLTAFTLLGHLCPTGVLSVLLYWFHLLQQLETRYSTAQRT